MAKVASRLEDGTLGQTPVEILFEPSTKESADHVIPANISPRWVDPIFEYLTKGKIPEDKNEARRVKYQANRYTVINEKLYM